MLACTDASIAIAIMVMVYALHVPLRLLSQPVRVARDRKKDGEMNRGGSLLILAGASWLVGCATRSQPSSAAPGAGGLGTSTAQYAPTAPGATAIAGTAPPEATAEAPSPAALVSLTPPPPAPAAATPPASQTTQNAASTPQKDTLDTHGMSAVVIHGKKVFCELEIPIGSRIPHKTCWTEAQLKEKQQAAQRMMMELDRHSAAGKQIPLECGAISGQAQPGC